MPMDGGYGSENLSPHLRYFTERCMAKGAARRKAEDWAWRQVVHKGKRKPTGGTHGQRP